MKKGQYYYLTEEPDDTKNPSGVIHFEKKLGLFWGDDGRNLPNISDFTLLHLKEGEFVDYLTSNLSLRIYSEKLKSIIDPFLTNIDKPIWHPIKVKHEYLNETRDYFILQFLIQPDVLDSEKTVYLDAKKKRIIKAYFEENLILNRHIFTYKEYANPTIISVELKNAIQKAKCTGIYMYDILSSGKLV